MPKKKSRRPIPPTGPKTDFGRETRVLLEDVRSELKVVAEGHTSIVKRLDGVGAKLIQHDHRFDRIEGQLGQLQQQVGSVLTDHESRLKVLEAK